MFSSRVCLFVFVFLFCSGNVVTAWELQLEGRFIYTYEWYDQQGSKGFFGPYDTDNGLNTNAANLNFWSNGARFDTQLATGKSSGWSFFKVEAEPTLKINEAIRARAKYRIASYGHPDAWDYISQTQPGVNVAISEGQWTLFWMTAQTPWGQVVFGKRPWIFGLGMQYDGNDSITSESILINAPYGPLDIGIGFYPYRYVGNSTLPELGDPFDLFPVREYFSRGDKSGSQSRDFLGYVVYHAGPVQAGVMGVLGSYHIGPEANLGPQQKIALDSSYTHGSVYLKYNNGRFFFNSEAAWVYWDDKYTGVDNLAALSGNRYIEQWRYVTELGFVTGPTKFSAMYAFTPGLDRRAGRHIDKQPAAFLRHPTFDAYFDNHHIFRAYAYIFAFNYGTGLEAYNLSYDGFARDTALWGGRIDYAVAANLNVYCSFMYANRVSNGYSWAILGPNISDNPPTFPNFPETRDGNISLNLNRYPDSPNIPDNSLGYEIDAGFDWQLLEKWTATVVLGYWQPGKWFNYACIDRSVPNWETGTPANNWGTRPNRKIDPIIGGEFTMTFDF